MSQTPSEIPDDVAFHVIVEASVLKEIVEPPVKLASDQTTNDKAANFRWSESQLRVRTVDGSQIMMVEQTVPSSSFEHYDFRTSGEITFGTACKRLDNLLKAADSDDLVELRLDLETNRLNIQFADVSYSLAGVDTSTINEPDMPDLDHAVCASAHSSVFERAHNVVGTIADTLTFEAGDGSFRIYGAGDTDTAEVSPEVTLDQSNLQADGIDVFLETDGPSVQSQYSSDYLKDAVSFLPDDYVTVELNTEMPMRINANRADARIPTEILVAPRIDDPA
ncbi:beta clamp domain-containing protein [Halorussus salinus]|uniref:hypothetical protein n=1 Tax=Halorussus salinus TaxID=1364935 RepID=UPI0010922F67|nr:hypothetical protein [Halorussus salinus]